MTVILIPSLNRPNRLAETAKHIHANTPNPHRIVWCVSDDESKEILGGLNEFFVDDSDCEDRRYVTRMNKLIGHIHDSESVFFGSDDVIHHQRWFEAAKEVMDEGFDVVVVNDLHNPSGTQALVRASYVPGAVFDSPGSAFHAGYLHNFADTEMFYTAAVRKTCAIARHSYVEHLHPVWGGERAAPWDATYLDAQKGWNHDAALWESRRMLIERYAAQ